MNFLLLNKIAVILINIVAIYLATLVVRSNRKGALRYIFLAMTASMLLWVDFAYLARITSFATLSPLYLRIAWFVTPWFFVFLYLLTIYLIEREEHYRILSTFVVGLGTISAFVTGFSTLIIKSTRLVEGDFTIIYGRGMIPFLTIISFFIIATLYPLFRKRFFVEGVEKKRLHYFIVGIFIFYTANAIFNITLPILFNVTRYYYLGDYSTIFLLGLTAYAIIVHRLFEIRVIATEILTASLWLFLAVRLFISTNLQDRLVDATILVLAVFFGIILIRNVMREIEQRERLEILTGQLEEANDELTKLDQAKSEFISLASHQLRAPLTVVKGYVSLIREGTINADDKQGKQALERVALSNEQLIRLVNSMLNLSRIESGKIHYEFSTNNLNEVINSVIEEYRPSAKERGVSLTYHANKKVPPFNFDLDKIRDTVINLVHNAIKYAPKGHVDVFLKSAESGQYAQITVSDNGIGIDPNKISRIFEKFERTEDAQKIDPGGMGIGLYFVKRVAEDHGGMAQVESDGIGKGSTFTVDLPIKHS